MKNKISPSLKYKKTIFLYYCKNSCADHLLLHGLKGPVSPVQVIIILYFGDSERFHFAVLFQSLSLIVLLKTIILYIVVSSSPCRIRSIFQIIAEHRCSSCGHMFLTSSCTLATSSLTLFLCLIVTMITYSNLIRSKVTFLVFYFCSVFFTLFFWGIILTYNRFITGLGDRLIR